MKTKVYWKRADFWLLYIGMISYGAGVGAFASHEHSGFMVGFGAILFVNGLLRLRGK